VSQRLVARGETLVAVEVLERINVGQQKHERHARGKPLRDRRLERPRVRQAGQRVAFCENAELREHHAVAPGEPADQCADRHLRERARERSHAQNLVGLDVRVQHDAAGIEARRQQPGDDPEPRAEGHAASAIPR
jgi:hypothetical protein